MPTQTDPSQTWLYDMIMAAIEPDLLTEMIPHLDEKYTGETEEQRKERMAHYEKAFAVFDDVFGEFRKQCEHDANAAKASKRAERAREEAEERVQDEQAAEGTINPDMSA